MPFGRFGWLSELNWSLWTCNLRLAFTGVFHLLPRGSTEAFQRIVTGQAPVPYLRKGATVFVLDDDAVWAPGDSSHSRTKVELTARQGRLLFGRIDCRSLPNPHLDESSFAGVMPILK